MCLMGEIDLVQVAHYFSYWQGFVQRFRLQAHTG